MGRIKRKQTKKVNVGGVIIGGQSPISIQSMANVKTCDIEGVTDQILKLEKAGCHIARCAVLDMESAKAIKEIKKRINIPLVSDVQFDYRLAVASIENGADKLRINPGNIGGNHEIAKVALTAKEYGVPIRVGVNAGSLEKDIQEKWGGPAGEAMVESALRNVEMLERYGVSDIVISIKSSNVMETVKAYEELSEKTDYPLHIGITEAGTPWAGGIKSAVGIGSILSRGIGDTIRVSLTGDPVEEVRCAREILKCLGYKGYGPEVIACPTCARTGLDLIGLAEKVEKRLINVKKDIKVAVMGCVVNGPGEAKEADIGIAGGKGCGVIFKEGQIVGKYDEDQLLDVLFWHIDRL